MYGKISEKSSSQSSVHWRDLEERSSIDSYLKETETEGRINEHGSMSFQCTSLNPTSAQRWRVETMNLTEKPFLPPDRLRLNTQGRLISKAYPRHSRSHRHNPRRIHRHNHPRSHLHNRQLLGRPTRPNLQYDQRTLLDTANRDSPWKNDFNNYLLVLGERHAYHRVHHEPREW